MKKLEYYFFRGLIFKLSFIPFPVLYFLSDIISFILFRIIRYRRSVIRSNLTYCFTQKSLSEILEIEKKHFRHFTNITLESLKALSTNSGKLTSRYTLTNPELLNDCVDHNRDAIILASHYNNWEWSGQCLGSQVPLHLIGYVKPLSNKHINKYLTDKRAGTNVSVISRLGAYWSLKKTMTKNIALSFVNDQYPGKSRRNKYVKFFNRRVAFHGGAEDLSNTENAKVFFLSNKKLKNGYYSLMLVDAEDYRQAEENITQAYARFLEFEIRKEPSQWLWTHKRFKDELDYS